MKSQNWLFATGLLVIAPFVHAQACVPTPAGSMESGHHLKAGQLQMASWLVQAHMQKTKVNPVFAADAKVFPQDGLITLEVTIAKDGSVASAVVTCGPKTLSTTAVDAVKQWTYKPYLVGGQPREVVTYVFLPYSLSAAQ